jgi:uncharacterized phiE125 gp8 family phage protein
VRIVFGTPHDPTVKITPYRSLRRVVQPLVEPVSLSEAKTHCRVDSDSEDAYIQSLIAAAREYVEETLDCTLVDTQWEAKYDLFPLWHIVLPRPPMKPADVTVVYRNEGGTLLTLTSAASQFQVDASTVPGRIYPLYEGSWPAVRGDENSVTITWSAGYGPSGQAVPATIKHMILLAVGHWYANREPVTQGSMMPVPMTFETLHRQASWGLYR